MDHFDFLLDAERRRALLSRWQAAITGLVTPYRSFSSVSPAG
jgi:hypothetical protein